MPRKSVYRAVADIDRQALAEFQAGIRKRYTDEQILGELKESAERLGRSPTMREFSADPESTVHPQTVIEHFGSWNAAKRAAGPLPRRVATRQRRLAAAGVPPRAPGCRGGCGRGARTAAARRAHATSTSTRGACRRSRSTGTPSA